MSGSQYMVVDVYPDGIPSGLALNYVDASTVRADWTLNSTNEYNVYLERSLDEITWTSYKLPAGTITYNDSGLTYGLLYHYRVRVMRAGYYSDSVSAEYDFAAPVVSSIVLTAPRTVEITYDKLLKDTSSGIPALLDYTFVHLPVDLYPNGSSTIYY